ncbi:MAG: DNA-3-methyladenine glycosylase I [Chloroflexi bacterium]|nr:MAG: DNA-3-methyladenine glycosylase I [Chloroflexota bacterium]
MDSKIRCAWVTDDPLYIQYHDEQWGVPVHDDQLWFEMLTLEGVQAGLSWLTVLRKRENYRKAFDNFNVEKIAHYDENKVQALLNNPGLIRNQAKIRASIHNAQAFIQIQAAFGSFDSYIWQFVNGTPIINHWKTLAEIPTETSESRAMSKDLKARGFKFVGPTICYALMQAAGMVNDHTVDCFCRADS